MKSKFFFVTVSLILLASLSSFSQENQKTSFAVQAGINLQNLTGKDYLGDKLENSIKPGFHFGANVIFPVAPDFYFQPGLLFSRKGARNTESSETVKINLCYIELPLNFLYRAQLGNGKILLGFGPYVAYAFRGKIVGDNEEFDIEFKNKVTPNGTYTTYMRAFDAGANIYAGYETAIGLYFQLNTQLGLLNINPEYEGFEEDKSILKNTGFGFSLGYRF